MVELQATRFWNAAIQSGLMDAARLEECWAEIPPERRLRDSGERRLARRAVDMGYVTLWQAQQLLMGRTGFHFDRYVILSVLGEGGMGRVYLGGDTKLGRKVALKVLSRERMNIPRAINRFHREARVGAQLQHENLVRIYDEGEANGNHFLVMEYIDGKTLGRIIHDRGPIPYPIACRLARQVALGLEHAHQKGMIHRDVNPMNVLVDRDGTAKLTDLGLAIDLADQEGRVTRDGATVGTFDYIAPEQARHSRNVDTRADIYSLGCSLYHMIAGRVPFPQPSLPEKLYAHQALAPEPLTSLVPGVPEAVDRVVQRMMAKSLAERFARPQDVADALEPFASGPVTLEAVQSAPRPETATEEAVVVIEEEAEKRPIDTDSDLVQIRNVSVNGAPGSEVLPYLDLGPPPALSDSASKEQSGDGVTSKRVWLWVGAAVALSLVVAAAVYLRGAGGRQPDTAGGSTQLQPRGSGAAKGESGDTQPTKAASGAAIVVRWSDGGETEEKSLQDAIHHATGKPAEVLLRGAEPLRFEVDKPVEVPEGKVVIRAAEGLTPILGVTLKGKAPWLRTNSRSQLTLIGLTIEAETSGKGADRRPTVIEAGAEVTLLQCVFTTSGRDPDLHALTSLGLKTTLAGCLFDGFNEPIRLTTYPASQVRLTQCILARSRSDESTPCWALALSGRSGQVRLERCTIAGCGLLAEEGFTPQAPVQIEVVDSLLRGPALLRLDTPKPDYAKAVRWTGRGNRYDISGSSWVVAGPRGFDTPPDAPTDLKTWTETTSSAETGSREGPIKFTMGDVPSPNPRQPGDFTVVDAEGPRTGADPVRVGPNAEKGKP